MIFSFVSMALGCCLLYFILMTYKNLEENKSAFFNLMLKGGVRDAFKILIIGILFLVISMGIRLFSYFFANIATIIAAFFQIACFYILSKITE